MHSARVQEGLRRQRVGSLWELPAPNNLGGPKKKRGGGGVKKNVGCVAALVLCNNSNQRAREMRI